MKHTPICAQQVSMRSETTYQHFQLSIWKRSFFVGTKDKGDKGVSGSHSLMIGQETFCGSPLVSLSPSPLVATPKTPVGSPSHHSYYHFSTITHTPQNSPKTFIDPISFQVLLKDEITILYKALTPSILLLERNI